MRFEVERFRALAAATVSVLALGMVSATPAMAAELKSAGAVEGADAGAEHAAVQELIAKADPFVSAAQGRFVLDPSAAAGTLTSAEITQVEEMVAGTNEFLAAAETDPALSVSPLGAKSFIAVEDAPVPRQVRMAFKEGVTKVEAQWFGLRVWLSKWTLQAVGTGVGIGGTFIPEPLISKIVAAFGFAYAGLMPGGIVFNWSPIFTPIAPFGTFWGQEWQ